MAIQGYEMPSTIAGTYEAMAAIIGRTADQREADREVQQRMEMLTKHLAQLKEEFTELYGGRV